MVEIYAAYINSCSAYKIVTPFEKIIEVVEGHINKAVLKALRMTAAKDVTLITKSNTYELINKGSVLPRDEVENTIFNILIDKNVTHKRIDADSQNQLVDAMKLYLEKAENLEKESFVANSDEKNIFSSETTDEFGYDDKSRYGFDSKGVHRNGTLFDDQGYEVNGFDKDGFNIEGYNRGGFDKYGFDKNGFDCKGYGKDGYNKDGYSILGFNEKEFDKDGYDREGFNARGFDRSGFDRQDIIKMGTI